MKFYTWAELQKRSKEYVNDLMAGFYSEQIRDRGRKDNLRRAFVEGYMEAMRAAVPVVKLVLDDEDGKSCG